MPFRKSYRKRKASKRSYGRRKFTLKRPVRRAGPKTYHFKQKCDLAPVTWGSNGAAQTGFYVFRLSDLPQWSTFQSLFDSYRINKVVLKFFPRYARNPMGINYPNATSGTTTGDYLGAFMPQAGRIYTAIDYTGIPTITADTQIQEYQNCKINAFTRPFSRAITPSTTLTPYVVTQGEGTASPVAATTVETQPRWKQWFTFPFDSDTTQSTPHLSLLWWIDPVEEEDSAVDVESAFSIAVAYDVSATYYFSVRSVR